MKYSVMLTVLLSLSASLAHADAIDPVAGKKLYEQSCAACHANLFGGDGSKIFTRPDHKVRSFAQLQGRVSGCSMKNNTGWFPSDEANVVAWLNQTYYRFK